MKNTALAQYTQPHQFESLLPQTGLDALRERSRAVVEQSLRLTAAAHPDTSANGSSASARTRSTSWPGMKTRIQALVTFRAAHDKRIRMEAALPLYHLFLAGPTSRGEFQQMTGLGERTARALLSHLIDTGLVTSAGHVAPVRFAFPLDALQFLLPELYPEAATRED